MTVPENSGSRPARPRTLQEDLLEDLKGTVPPPVPAPTAGRRRKPPQAHPSKGAQGDSPTVELQLTRTRWASPSVRPAAGRSGVVLSAGPFRVSVSLLGR
jgi:hypothetical protein